MPEGDVGKQSFRDGKRCEHDGRDDRKPFIPGRPLRESGGDGRRESEHEKPQLTPKKSIGGVGVDSL
jgi:hypothetical protein